jgi:hypothetical protein
MGEFSRNSTNSCEDTLNEFTLQHGEGVITFRMVLVKPL